MVETALALISMLIGLSLGWWFGKKTDAVAAEKTAQAAEQKITQLDSELRSVREQEVAARTNLANSQTQFAAEKQRLTEIRGELENSFKAMAADIAGRNAETFLKQAGEQFKSLKQSSEQDLDAKKKMIDKSLSGMNEKLDHIHTQSTELKTSIETSQRTTEVLSENTARLREILSSSQQRGQWGERIVEDILGFVGLLEKIHYTKQSQVASGQRPDFTFILPQEKKLNMDVKFPLAHYENYLFAEDDEIRAREKAVFMRNVRTHIQSVCGREYINPAEGTLEYVMLFIPNESIYGFIHSEDADLIDYALQKRVLLCSPLTLYAMLSLIHQATRNFTMNERASEVMALVGQFREQWKRYIEQMDRLGRNIETVSKQYQTLITTRTRTLEKPLDKLETIALPTVQGELDIHGDAAQNTPT